MGVIRNQRRSAINASTIIEPREPVISSNDNLFPRSSDDESREFTPEPTDDQQLMITQPEIEPYRKRIRLKKLRNRPAAIPCDTIDHQKNKLKGANKCRRYENQLILLKSCESEDLDEVTIEDLSPKTCRTFGRILENSHLLNIWNNFIDRENQNTVEKTKYFGGQTESDAFNGICRRLRSMLRQRHLPLGMMDNLEESLLSYFFDHPCGIFESSPMDGFRRSLLHALSQYNNLCSYSINYKKDKKNKIVRVKNKCTEFSPPAVRLVHYIDKEFHRNINILPED